MLLELLVVMHAKGALLVEKRPQNGQIRVRGVFAVILMLKVSNSIRGEQFVGISTSLQLAEKPGDCWHALREQLQRSWSRVRTQDLNFLFHALLDRVILPKRAPLDALGGRL